MTDENKKYPRVATGAYIFNKEGKLFLMRGKNKFNNVWYIPGGHVNWGESAEECVIREIKEETGLDIKDVKFLRMVEFIFEKSYSTDKHFVSFNYTAYTDAPDDAVILDNREATEYQWIDLASAVKLPDIENITRETIENYLLREKSADSEDYKTSWQRATADYQNLKKEVEMRRAEWAQMSEQQILEEFIPVYDNFKKAFAAKLDAGEATDAIKKWENWKQGIQYIMKQFSDVLKAHQVEEIKTVGEKFDPTKHESVGEEENDNYKTGMICREAEGGYTKNGRIIKPAKVILSK